MAGFASALAKKAISWAFDMGLLNKFALTLGRLIVLCPGMIGFFDPEPPARG